MLYTVATESQMATATSRYPRLAATDAVQLCLTVQQARRDLRQEDRDAEMREIEAVVREMKGERFGFADGRYVRLDALHVEGYFDRQYDEFVSSETQGSEPLVYGQRKYRTRLTAIKDLTVVVAGEGSGRTYVPSSDMLEDSDSVVALRMDYEDGMAAHSSRFESDAQILRRWNVDEDELAYRQWIRDEGRESEWVELMTEFRKTKLRRTLAEYYEIGPVAWVATEEDLWKALTDFPELDEDEAIQLIAQERLWKKNEIVIRWQQVWHRRDKRYFWMPLEKASVVKWIALSVEAQGGSQLEGYGSAILSLKKKMALRRRKEVAA